MGTPWETQILQQNTMGKYDVPMETHGNPMGHFVMVGKRLKMQGKILPNHGCVRFYPTDNHVLFLSLESVKLHIIFGEIFLHIIDVNSYPGLHCVPVGPISVYKLITALIGCESTKSWPTRSVAK